MVAVDRVECLANEGEQPELVFVHERGKLEVSWEEMFLTINEMVSHGD